MRARLLVVDDEAVNLEIIAEYLEAEACELTMAADGGQALELLRSGDADFDAVVLDRMMPGIDGLAVLREIKATPALRSLPVILQTAAAGREQVAEGLKLGAYYYLTKPYHRDALVAVVRAALADTAQRRDLARRIEESRAVMDLIEHATFRFRTLEDARALAAACAGLCEEPDLAGMGLAELLVNAIEHGNLGITFHEKSELLAAGRWEEEVSARLRRPENLERAAELECWREGACIAFAIRDCGPGFAWERFLAAGRDACLPSQRSRHRACPEYRLPYPRVPRVRQRSGRLGSCPVFTPDRRPGTGAAMNRAEPGDTVFGRELEELERAADLITAMMEDPGLRDPALAWAVQPLEGFSGDAVAARRTPSGRLLTMLADATGHGLAAAGSLLPVLRVFYAQAQLDQPASALVREINGCLEGAARTGRFVAAVVVEIDADGRRGAVWNGGMPPGLWLRDQGEIATEALRPRHPPLGVLADTQFDPTCTSLDAGAGGHLLFCSDGLLEAAGPAGEAFGVERLRENALAVRAADATVRVQAAVHAHLGGVRAADDISLLLIDLGRAP